jgi:hypothetical protein
MSPVKEPNFFLAPDAPIEVPTEQEYLKLFAGASTERWLGEASTRYFADARVPARIRHAAPKARLLITLRDPVERGWSHYWHNVKYGVEERSFVDAVEEQLADPEIGESSDPWHTYVSGGMYTRALRRYLETFGDAVFVLIFEEFRQEPQRWVASVLEFLGVDTVPSDTAPLDAYNAFALPRGRVANRLWYSPRARAAGRRIFPRSLRPRVERLVLRRRQKPAIDAALQERLRAAFAEDRKSLERLLGRPVPWPRVEA